jgi:uncharacterized protein YceK
MDVGMDENWATIAIEQLGLPISGVLANFFFLPLSSKVVNLF